MQNLLRDLTELLSKDDRLVSEGKLLKNKVVELALKMDAALIKHLLKSKPLKKHFFTDIDGIFVFDKIKFQKFVSNKEFLPDSYTAFKNKIGLVSEAGDYLSESKEVVLAWPYKDCVLEGGQTKEDQKRNEIFWNETLAPDEIDRLLAPKVLTSFKKYDTHGEHVLKGNEEIDFTKENLIIKGNNLLALHSLYKRFAGKVKLIYIDPPYNTGNDSFQYNDSFNHSTWLVFLRNRLEVAKQLLKKEGTIAISIDQNEIAYLLILLDEIFEKENRKNIITVKRGSVTGAKVINPGVVNISEYVVIYSKDSKYWNPNRVFRHKERDDRYNQYIRNFNDKPEKWKFITLLDAFSEFKGISKNKLKKTLGNDYEKQLEEFVITNQERTVRFAALDDKSISAAALALKYKSKGDATKVYKLEREDNRPYYVYRGELILFAKDRLTEIDNVLSFGELITDIWDDVLPNDLHNEGGIQLRKGKKPEKLISRIFELGSDERDLILDFFIGSGTAASVALKLNRQFIGVEQLDYIEQLPVIRLKNTIKGDPSGISKSVNWQGGGSFIYCELMQHNEAYIDRIQKAKTTKDLRGIWNEMQDKAFISYKVDVKAINENISDFEKLNLDEQKRFLVEILDKNQLYVNYSEIDDKEYGVSEPDKKLNRKFYGAA